jgi:hypothetical protein
MKGLEIREKWDTAIKDAASTMGLLPNDDIAQIKEDIAEMKAMLITLTERKKPKKSLLNEWIPPAYVDDDIWNAFIQHRKEKQQALKETSYKWCLTELDKIHKAGHDVNAAITKSISNGYTGIFAPTKPTKKEPKPVYSQAHKPASFSRDLENSLDNVDPYSELKV